MDFQTIITNQVNADRNERMKTSTQLTISELILKLEAVEDKTVDCSFDFEYAHPTCLSSWRGSYNEIAFEFSFEGDRPTVELVIDMLKTAIGREYTGYKGGEFVMGKNTPVWVANYGNSGNTGVVDILDKGYCVYLITSYCEF